MKISNFLHRLRNVELPENQIRTNQVFLMKMMAITNNVICPFLLDTIRCF